MDGPAAVRDPRTGRRRLRGRHGGGGRMDRWETGMTVASSFTLFFYVVAMAFALIYGGFRQRILFVLTMVSAGAGFVVQTWQIAEIWLHRGYPPATNLM